MIPSFEPPDTLRAHAAPAGAPCTTHAEGFAMKHATPTDPGYQLARRQMDGFGTLVTFDLVGGKKVHRTDLALPAAGQDADQVLQALLARVEAPRK